MPRDGSGNYVPPNGSWTTGVGNGVDATIADWSALLNDISNALSQSVSKDGQTSFTNHVPFGTKRATNLGNPVSSQDAVTLAYLLASTVLAATKLATARLIGGVSFDGTSDINLPGVNESGNQNTSGYAEHAKHLYEDGNPANAALRFTQVDGGASGGYLWCRNESDMSQQYLLHTSNLHVLFSENSNKLNGLTSSSYKLVAPGADGIGSNTIFGITGGYVYTIGSLYTLSGFTGSWRCTGRCDVISSKAYLFEKEY